MSENKFKQLTSINTKDGSPTLEIEGIEETYHSRHGAVQESMHVFIENGLLNEKIKSFPEIYLLEVGWGTGLNTLLSMLAGRKDNLKINYHALEKFPLEKKLHSSLDFSMSVQKYFPEISSDEINSIFQSLIDAQWDEPVVLNDHFSFLKSSVGLLEADLHEYDLIYYDAFGPRAQSEMWESNCFEKISPHIPLGGQLVTYCTQGQFRRNLSACGWKVNKVPGPPGKREMSVAEKVSELFFEKR